MFIPDKYLVIFDLETTQTLTGIPEIIEIGAVKVDRELESVDVFETFVKPRDISGVDRHIERLTGISPHDLADAPSFDDIWEDFAKFTGYNQSRLCSWGTAFDVAILREEYKRRNLGYPHLHAPIDASSVVWTVGALWGIRFSGMSLQGACDRFGVDRHDTHRALGDAKDVLCVFKEIRNLTLKGLEDGTSEKLLPNESGGQSSLPRSESCG